MFLEDFEIPILFQYLGIRIIIIFIINYLYYKHSQDLDLWLGSTSIGSSRNELSLRVSQQLIK